MLFNSYLFILLFLPAAVAGYYILGGIKRYGCRLSLLYLAVMSLLFYGYFNPRYLFMIGASIWINYGVSKILCLEHCKDIVRKGVVTAGILFNLGLLFYFKYYDFFIENINHIFSSSFEARHIMLPLGISFFTFQQISCVADAYKEKKMSGTFLEYVVFVSFFPQLIAGPIVRYDEIIPQFQNKENRRVNWDHMAAGIFMFAAGLSKKVLVADTFGRAVSYGYGHLSEISSLEAGITILSYTIQIYFDFSGYCDMASGAARMFNIILPVNFDSPYQSFSIIEFWERWHMTLTRFLRQYVYVPLGGSRNGKGCTCINIMIVFLVSGLWHGANWTFILWGALHGLFNVCSRLMKKQWEKLHAAAQWILTFVFINYTWAIFRADDMMQGLRMIWKSVHMRTLSLSEEFAGQFLLTEINWLYGILKKIPVAGRIVSVSASVNGGMMRGMILFTMFIILNTGNCQKKQIVFHWKQVCVTVILFVWSFLSLSEVSTFLYFNF